MVVADIAAFARAVVLVIAVIAGATLLARGFALTVMEYRIFRRKSRVDELLKAATEGKMQADLLKGTLSLSGVTQGVLLCGLGTVLISIVAFQDLNYTSTSEQRTPIVLSATQVLDRWLEAVKELEGKTLEEQHGTLVRKFGDHPMLIKQYFPVAAESYTSIAAKLYGGDKYGPLVRVFNERLPDATVPPFAQVKVLSPPDLAESTIATKSVLQIAGGSPSEVYSEWLKMAQVAMKTPGYPEAFWRERDLLDFGKALGQRFGYPVGYRQYQPEKGDSPTVVARVLYDGAQFVDLLRFFNPTRDREFVEGRLDTSKPLQYLQLSIPQ